MTSTSTTRTPRPRASRRPAAPLSVEESQALIAQQMTEKTLQAYVVRLAQSLGYRMYHTWNSTHSAAGWPDLTMVGPAHLSTPFGHRRLVFAELKREDKNPTDAQMDWIMALRDCGVEAYVWRPSDWLNGTIQRRLR